MRYFKKEKHQYNPLENAKTVDAVIFHEEKVVLIKRKNPPFQGEWALPGGFIERREKPKSALKRETKEETNLSVTILRKIGVYNTPGRDPRGDVSSHVYLCKIDGPPQLLDSGSDAAEVSLVPFDQLTEINLAFDHRKIINDALLLLEKYPNLLS